MNVLGKALKIVVFNLVICLLLWNIGAGVLPVSTLPDAQLTTPTNTQVAGESLSDTKILESDTPTLTPTSTFTATAPGVTTTFTQISESATGEPNRVPVPAIFSAGVYAPNELVVRFKASTSEKRIETCFQGIDIQILSEIEVLRVLVLKVVSGDIRNAFDHILDCAGVLYVEPNFLLQAAETIPSDPDWGLQYGLINIRAPQGWDLSTGSTSVTIAIVDTGVDYAHPDLAGKLVAGYDFVNDDNNPQDDNGHGTHVAGIAAASSNNGAGIAGVSWGARIMPVKVLNASGGGTYANAAEGTIWAVDHGAQVINLSLGGTGPSSILADAINYAHSRGAVIVAAAGNTGSNFVLYPARYPNVIAVARTNSANHWDGSSYGPEVDLSAPGTQIYSTAIGGYSFRSGSSMSTGFVSGLAAILMGIPGNASPDLIEAQMESTALDIEFTGWDEYTGAGLIQMDAAMQLALLSMSPADEPRPSPGGNGAGFVQVVPTNTPISIWNAAPTLPSLEPIATIASATGIVDIETEPIPNTPTGEENEVEAQEDSGIGGYSLPCAGILLIVFGIALIWITRRKKQK